MAKKPTYDFERELLQGNKSMSEEDQKLLSEFDITENDLKEMDGFLNSVEEWSIQDDIKPSVSVKSNLMAEFETERRKGAFVWLNSLLVWLFPPSKPMMRSPGFQMALVSACVVLIILSVNIMDEGKAESPVAHELEETKQTKPEKHNATESTVTRESDSSSDEVNVISSPESEISKLSDVNTERISIKEPGNLLEQEGPEETEYFSFDYDLSTNRSSGTSANGTVAGDSTAVPPPDGYNFSAVQPVEKSEVTVNEDKTLDITTTSIQSEELAKIDDQKKRLFASKDKKERKSMSTNDRTDEGSGAEDIELLMDADVSPTNSVSLAQKGSDLMDLLFTAF